MSRSAKRVKWLVALFAAMPVILVAPVKAEARPAYAVEAAAFDGGQDVEVSITEAAENSDGTEAKDQSQLRPRPKHKASVKHRVSVKHYAEKRPEFEGDKTARRNKAIAWTVLHYKKFKVWAKSLRRQFNCLDPLWKKESGWHEKAGNPELSYGIPQAYPGSKMAAFGRDWMRNPKTQILWGLSYIMSKYKSPCGAWKYWKRVRRY